MLAEVTAFSRVPGSRALRRRGAAHRYKTNGWTNELEATVSSTPLPRKHPRGVRCNATTAVTKISMTPLSSRPLLRS